MDMGGEQSLGALVERVETDRKTVRICNFTGDITDLRALRNHLQRYGVEVDVDHEAPTRSGDRVTVEHDGTRLASSPVERVVDYVTDPAASSPVDQTPPAVVDALADTFFEGFGKQRMRQASRRVERAAIEAGEGTLHAGFQSLANLAHQREVYERLAASKVETHVYGTPAPETTRGLDVHVHPGTGPEFQHYWWVVHDGPDTDPTMLLAEEREPDRFDGFWTHDSDVVDDALDRLATLRRAAAGPSAAESAATADGEATDSS